jgi:hypothetical protein
MEIGVPDRPAPAGSGALWMRGRRVDWTTLQGRQKARVRRGQSRLIFISFDFTGFDISFDPAHVVNCLVRSEEGCPARLCLFQRNREEQTSIGFVPKLVVAEVLEMDHLSLLDVLFDDHGFRVDVPYCEFFLLHKFCSAFQLLKTKQSGVPSRTFTGNLTLRTRPLCILSYGDKIVRAGRVALRPDACHASALAG